MYTVGGFDVFLCFVTRHKILRLTRLKLISVRTELVSQDKQFSRKLKSTESMYLCCARIEGSVVIFAEYVTSTSDNSLL